MQLTDKTPIEKHLTFLLDMYANWNRHTTANRKTNYELAVNELLTLTGLPTVTIGWQDDGGYFAFGEWKLVMDGNATTMNPHIGDLRGDGFAWPWHSTVAYHELRHCEQFFLACQAMLLGAVAIPSGSHGRSVLHTHDQATLIRLGFPGIIVQKADSAKTKFSQSDIPRVRAWVESVFGRGGRARRQTLGHLDKSTMRWVDYTHLPEEADAWALQRKMSLQLRQRIQDSLSEEAIHDVHTLFDRVSYQEWMQKTQRGGLHYRSSDLRAVDEALKVYDGSMNETTLKALRTEFFNWYRRNPKEASARNVDEVVQRLKSFLE